MVDSLSYFLFQPVLHDWCNKGPGMCYPVCGMMHIKESLLLIGKSSPCGGSGFLLSLSEWSFTICLTPYNHASLNKTFPSFRFRYFIMFFGWFVFLPIHIRFENGKIAFNCLFIADNIETTMVEKDF